MKVLLKKATILQPGLDPGPKKDILIEDGIISRIGASISDGTATIVESRDLHVSTGWLDIGSQPGQPGYEYRETFHSLSFAGRAGGYTGLATFPRNQPPIQSRIEIEYVRNIYETLPLMIYPIGAISQNLEGKDLTEMIDMIDAGARAFSDGRKNPVDSGLLVRALEYVMPFDSVIIDFPLDRSFTTEGQIHEGSISASLGLTGIPTIAEEIIVQRDIQLLAYTGSRLHLHGVTSALALSYIQKAKAAKHSLTCDVPALHLYLEDKDIGDFDSYRKVLPPLRSISERKALIKAIKDGVIDHISSIHTPLEIETKDCEFTYASFGSVGLEASFSAAHTALKDSVPLRVIVDKFSSGPRRILGLDVEPIEKGQRADLTFFDPSEEWTYEGTTHSLSQNDALAGSSFSGKVIGTLCKGHLMIN
jgi:dihydroorotase